MGEERAKRGRFYDPETDQLFEVLKEDEDYLVVFERDNGTDKIPVIICRPSEETTGGARETILASWYIDDLPRASTYDVARMSDHLLNPLANKARETIQTDALPDAVPESEPPKITDESDVRQEFEFEQSLAATNEPKSTIAHEAAPEAELKDPPPFAIDTTYMKNAEASLLKDQPRAYYVEPIAEELAAAFSLAETKNFLRKESLSTTSSTPPDHNPELCNQVQEAPSKAEITDEKCFTVRCDDPDTISITNLTTHEPLRNVVIPETINGKLVTGITLTSLGLESLDLSHCPHLRQLLCFDNSLRKLDLTKCPHLEFLNCTENPLKVLDIRGCTNVAARYDPNVQVLQ